MKHNLIDQQTLKGFVVSYNTKQVAKGAYKNVIFFLTS